MKLNLKKKPKGVTLITGFPGVGLVGTIVTKFLIDKLDVEKIGNIHSHSLIPIVAIHKDQAVEPLGIFYNKKYNLVILQALTGVNGIEWEISHTVIKLATEINAKEIINIESMLGSGKTNTFYYTQNPKRKKDFEKLKISPLKEGIIIGVGGALMLENKFPLSTIVSQAHYNLPDSESAAEVVKILDKLLGMELDFKPLLVAAKKFESQLKGMMEQSQELSAKQKREKREQLDYLG